MKFYKFRILAFVLVFSSFLSSFTVQAAIDEIKSGIELFESGEIEKAKFFFQDYVTKNPDNAEGYYYLGRIFFRQVDYKLAEKNFKKAIELEPNSSNYHTWLGNTYGSKINTVSFFKKMGMAKKIKKHFSRALELDANNLDAREGLIQYYTEAPGIAGGSTEKAMEHAAILKNQDKYRGYSFLAQIYEKQKKYDLAEQEFISAVEEFPDSLRGHYRLGYFYQRMEKWEKAFDMFEKMVADSSQNWGAWYQLGRTGALSKQKLDRSEDALKKYLSSEPGKNNPSFAAAHWRLGMVYEHKGEKNLARQEYQASLELDPKFEQAKKALKKLK